MLSDNPRDEKHVGCKTARRQRRSLGLARQKSARWARLEDGDAGIIDGLTTERLCSCWRAPARDEAVCLHTTQPANHDSTATNPRLRAACDWSAQRFLREMRPPRSTVRHILDNQAEDDDGGGRHGRPRETDTTDKPRWRALQQLLL
jgi:hypothetical protein